jgi:hypothetical protein
VASVAGGRKFENGAITGAFGYLFNDMATGAQAKAWAEGQYAQYNPGTTLLGQMGQAWLAVMSIVGFAPEYGTMSGTVAVVDHIVLGLADYGLETTAASVGGRTLLRVNDWQTTLMESLGNPTTRFTVSLDGFEGATTYDQVMGAVSRGFGSAARATEWEMSQLYQAQRLGSTTFVSGGKVVQNPF